MQIAETGTNIVRLWGVGKQLNYPALGIVAILTPMIRNCPQDWRTPLEISAGRRSRRAL